MKWDNNQEFQKLLILKYISPPTPSFINENKLFINST